MSVSAVIVTRGNVDLDPILESLPPEWEPIVWDNGAGVVYGGHGTLGSARRPDPPHIFGFESPVEDLAVYGRYAAALSHAHHDSIYVQDDDCVLHADSFEALQFGHKAFPDGLVANMPERFLPHYSDSCLVGFGAMFDRKIARAAFERWNAAALTEPYGWFCRVCDVIFTALVGPHVLLDLPYRDLPWATGDDRMYRQQHHVGERALALKLARKARDG